MTRASGSVPENRTSTRPDPSSADSQARISSNHARQLVERPALLHPNIHEQLREDGQIGRQFVQRGLFADAGLQQFQRRQHAVTGGRIFPKDDVTRLFPAERGVPPQHLFEHILVADRRANHFDSEPAERLLQPEIRHHGGHHHIARQMAVSQQPPAAISIIASPLIIRPRGEINIARSASPSKATPASAP